MRSSGCKNLKLSKNWEISHWRQKVNKQFILCFVRVQKRFDIFISKRLVRIKH